MAKGYFPEKASTENNNNSSDSARMSAARSRLTLPLNQMALPIYTSPPSWQDVEIGGQVLFEDFVHRELRNEGLPENAIPVENPPPGAYGDAGASEFFEEQGTLRAHASVARTPEGFTNQNFAALGQNISALAEEFARSRQGQQIRQQADEVDLGSVTQEAFAELLNGVFSSGVDQYRIVAVFNFCSHLLIRCVKKKLISLGTQLFFWALGYIQKKVCKWVYEHGGWERVIKNVYNFTKEVCFMAAVGIIVICGAIYIRKNLLN